MSIFDAIREKFGPKRSAEESAQVEAIEERERGMAMRSKTYAAAAKKKKDALSWSGASYAGRVKGSVDEMEK